MILYHVFPKSKNFCRDIGRILPIIQSSFVAGDGFRFLVLRVAGHSIC